MGRGPNYDKVVRVRLPNEGMIHVKIWGEESDWRNNEEKDTEAEIHRIYSEITETISVASAE